jgi:hypothetical protein
MEIIRWCMTVLTPAPDIIHIHIFCVQYCHASIQYILEIIRWCMTVLGPAPDHSRYILEIIRWCMTVLGPAPDRCLLVQIRFSSIKFSYNRHEGRES